MKLTGVQVLGGLAEIILLFLLFFTKITAEAPPDSAVFDYIEEHKEEHVQRLREWVSIESDSSNPKKRCKVVEMMNLTAKHLTQLGAKVELVELGKQKLENGSEIPLPPVILAEIRKDPKRPTVCFYGHLDVQPARYEDGWSTQPYILEEKNGSLYGRGTSDDKGQVLAVLHAIEALQKHVYEELPVNVKFVFEGMEEVGSNGLFPLVEERNSTFFSDVDYIVITDTSWLSKKPGITYGTRGNTYFFIEVECASQDLHSGNFGGVIHEATSDLIFLLNTLADSSGKILVPGIYDAVANISDKEKEYIEKAEFNLEEIKANLGVNFRYNTKQKVLIQNTCYPSLSIHGIEGAFSASGTKTVIPAKVIGKFSIRLVPKMDPSVVEKQVIEYLYKKFEERNSPNRINVTCVIKAKPWVYTDTDGPLYLAGKNAIKRVFNTEADLFREGGTIPIGSQFYEVTGKGIMFLGIGGPDDAPHGQNEKLDRYNFIEGTKLFAALLEELASL